jgi:hypothetical protein
MERRKRIRDVVQKRRAEVMIRSLERLGDDFPNAAFARITRIGALATSLQQAKVTR